MVAQQHAAREGQALPDHRPAAAKNHLSAVKAAGKHRDYWLLKAAVHSSKHAKGRHLEVLVLVSFWGRRRLPAQAGDRGALDWREEALDLALRYSLRATTGKFDCSWP